MRATLRADAGRSLGVPEVRTSQGIVFLIIDFVAKMTIMRSMPAKSPASGPSVAAALIQLGMRIRAQRRALGVSVVTAAESATMSRVTWHRIERGEASVTMGAYLNAMHALGLALDTIAQGSATFGSEPLHAAEAIPEPIRLSDYAELRQLAWSIPGIDAVTPTEALGLYERNWRHVDVERMTLGERALLDGLVRTVGRGHLLV